MTGTVHIKQPVKKASVSATITRADGRVEELGVISYYHKNPLKRAWWHALKWIKDRRK